MDSEGLSPSFFLNEAIQTMKSDASNSWKVRGGCSGARFKYDLMNFRLFGETSAWETNLDCPTENNRFRIQHITLLYVSIPDRSFFNVQIELTEIPLSKAHMYS